MDQDLRALLAQELAAIPQPPLGDLVEGSVRRGRRLRAVRRAWTGGAVAASVMLAFGALGGAAPFLDRRAQVSVQAPAGPVHLGRRVLDRGPTGDPPATAPGAVPSSEARVTATPAGLLALLTSLLPRGRTTGYAGNPAPELMVQTYLDAGQGPGMIRVSVGTVEWTGYPDRSGAPDPTATVSAPAAPAASDPGTVDHMVTTTRTLPGIGTLEITRIPDNCLQSLVVAVHRTDGTFVQVSVASCLAWDGRRNARGRSALTLDQAITIASDPRWGTSLPRSLVATGARRFPHLTAIG